MMHSIQLLLLNTSSLLLILSTSPSDAFLSPTTPRSTSHRFASPANEFSRIVQPARVLRRRTNGSYQISIEAKPEECQALAQRFQLSDIAALTADVTLQAEWATGSSGGVEVQGTCGATVTQRCVRTNEEFSATMEFPLYCIVRPTAGIGMDEAAAAAPPQQQQRPGKKGSKKNVFDDHSTSIDMTQLQSMLEDEMYGEDDDLMEDEMIYSAADGRLDVGELVAQLFWLKLDPYPKKPGTEPVRRSLSG